MHPEKRSPSWLPSSIRCRRRAALRGGRPRSPYGPTEALFPTPPREGRRHREHRDAFHRCAACVAWSDARAKYARGLFVHAAHVPIARRGTLVEHCKHRSAVTCESTVNLRKDRRLCYRHTHAWYLINQAWNAAQLKRPSVRTECLTCTTQPQRPNGFYDRELTARCAANLMTPRCRTRIRHSIKKSP